MRKYRNYTDEDIIKAVEKADSMADLLRALDLVPIGGNYIHMRKQLQRLELKCKHWTGQGWNKDKQLKDWANYRKVESLKIHLIKLKGHQCEKCCLKTWQEQPILIEVHHLDGDRTNNNLDNLELLCPNCHAQTPTFRNRKRL